jgi:hypothetical protein
VHPLPVRRPGGAELVAELDGRLGVGDRPGEAGERLTGGGVGGVPLGPQAGQGLVEHRLALPPVGLHDLGPEHAIEEEVAVHFLVRRAGLDDGHVDSQSGTGRRVEAGVVALADVDQDEGVAPLGPHVGHPELEGTHLVAPEGEAGQVVPLDQDAGPAEGGGQLGGLLERGGDEGERDPGQAGDVGADLLRRERLGGADGHRCSSSPLRGRMAGRVALVP